MGVVGLITPWNWPLNQIALKVAPCIAAGNTMVLKPSEECPGNAAIFAEVMDAAGVPPGVFNLVQGDGPTVGAAISAHPDIDMVSFTGSTRAGILVAKAAADTVKRVHQELGGKSPNVVLPDAKFEEVCRRPCRASSSTAARAASRRPESLCRKTARRKPPISSRRCSKAHKVGDPLHRRRAYRPGGQQGAI
jgi:aldehyde dehydrogenase (NAD+)